MLYIIDCILLLFFCRVTNVAELNSHIKAKHGISVDVTNWTFSFKIELFQYQSGMIAQSDFD